MDLLEMVDFHGFSTFSMFTEDTTGVFIKSSDLRRAPALIQTGTVSFFAGQGNSIVNHIWTVTYWISLVVLTSPRDQKARASW